MTRAAITAFALMLAGMLTAGQKPTLVKADFERIASGTACAGVRGSAFSLGVVAETLFREARGEGCDGVEAVASVIYNRSLAEVKGGCKNPLHDIIPAVCMKPRQFSCWNGVNAANAAKRIATTRRPRGNADRKMLAFCRNVASRMLSGEFVSSGTYTHYYANNRLPPKWSCRLVDREVIKGHTFGRMPDDE